MIMIHLLKYNIYIYNKMVKLASYKTNEIKRSYYLNLFSSNAEKTVKVETYRNTANTADVNVIKIICLNGI